MISTSHFYRFYVTLHSAFAACASHVYAGSQALDTSYATNLHGCFCLRLLMASDTVASDTVASDTVASAFVASACVASSA